MLVERIRGAQARVAVIGLGYVGLPLAVETTRTGFVVAGIERESDRVEAINRGQSYIADVADTDLAEVVRTGRFAATQDYDALAAADVIVICVPTPLHGDRTPDTSHIESVVDRMLPHLRRGQLVLLESTSYPGTTEELLLPRIVGLGLTPGVDLFLAFSPERVDPGNTRYRIRGTPKVVGGVTPACAAAAGAFYEKAIEAPVVTVSSPRVAEMAKLLENTFRAVNIALANELALLCERLKIDVWAVIEAASTKPFGFMPFFPGPGPGGHCIPVDPYYLVWRARARGFSPGLVERANEINAGMAHHAVQRVVELLGDQGRGLSGAEVLLLGVAYKRDSRDFRESPALEIARLLDQRGALVSYHDPHVLALAGAGLERRSVDLSPARLAAVDLVVITTDHSAVDYALVARHARLVLDTRNAMREHLAPHVHRLGVRA